MGGQCRHGLPGMSIAATAELRRTGWRISPFALLVGPGVIFLVLTLLLPLLAVVVFSFWPTESYELYADWNLDNYRVLFTEPAYRTFLLRSILGALDIPELEPVPRDHVLTKTFYLLKEFPGRFASGQLWVEATPAPSDDEQARPARAGDGVSSILITSNDLAGAWAQRNDGLAEMPLLSGENRDSRQREFAFRAGVNIVMYTLTGNYKADQVHVPALLERLGQ